MTNVYPIYYLTETKYPGLDEQSKSDSIENIIDSLQNVTEFVNDEFDTDVTPIEAFRHILVETLSPDQLAVIANILTGENERFSADPTTWDTDPTIYLYTRLYENGFDLNDLDDLVDRLDQLDPAQLNISETILSGVLR